MAGIEYVTYACAFVVLAVAFNLFVKWDAKAGFSRDWVAKDLKRGDLYSLIDVASGLRPDGLTRDQARRLAARGMIYDYGNGNYRATLKGRLALRLREVARQTVRSE